MIALGLCGSLRRDSYNRRLLEAAAAGLPRGVTFEVYEGLADVPPYNEDCDEDDSVPEAVRALREEIAAADAVLIATPEYNASVPGHLKNALDWASRPFPDNALRGKPVAVVGASTGLFGAVEFEVRVPKAQLQRAEVVLIARQLGEMQLRDPDGLSIVIVEVPEHHPLRRC
jgi:chromate reductase, NAD(P)H dehydrogenase (quinone)